MHKIECHCESCYMDLAAEKAKLQQENEELKNSSFPDQEIAKKALLERDELLIQIQAQAERIEKLKLTNKIQSERMKEQHGYITAQAERIEKLGGELCPFCEIEFLIWDTDRNMRRIEELKEILKGEQVENSILWEKNRTQAERIENLLTELLRLCEAEWQAVDNHPGSRWANEVAFFKQALEKGT